MHHRRDEHWIVVRGRAEVTLEERVFSMEANAVVHIPAASRHRLANRERTPLVLIEVQYGAYLGEDDIVRFADIYGRAPGA
jgi:mannose-6-phosphate isomerase-like protein (cupin superfamily)